MNDYSQPEFYRFNSDSIKIVKFILSRHINPDSIVDLGAGCGVIGIELSRLLKPRKLTLLELQGEFQEHLKMNADFFLRSDVETEIIIKPLSEWIPQHRYSLIVSNPPYYLEGSGQPSPNSKRNLARIFQIDGWSILISKISCSLESGGRAFVVLKKDLKIREMVEELSIREKLSVFFHDTDQLWIIEFCHFD